MANHEKQQNARILAQIDVTIAGLSGKDPVKCSRNVVIVPDTSLDEVRSQEFDIVILPGGAGGAKALAAVGGLSFFCFQQISFSTKHGAFYSCCLFVGLLFCFV